MIRICSSRTAAAALAGLAMVASLSACGSSSPNDTAASTSGTAASGVDNAIAAMLPASIKASGKIVDAESWDFPPFASVDANGKFVGGDVDMLNALGKVLGVTIEFTRISPYANLIPSVVSGRAQISAQSFGVTDVRRTQVDYVQFGSIGQGLLVRKGNPSGITVNDLCGHSIGVESGSIEVSFYQDTKNKECTDAGKHPITVHVYNSEVAQQTALNAGRDDAMGVATSTVKTIANAGTGTLEALPGSVPDGDTPVGAILAPHSEQLGKAIEAGLNKLLADGTLDQINAKWAEVTAWSIKYLPTTAS